MLGDYLATKRVLIPALSAMTGGPGKLFVSTAAVMHGAVTKLL